MPRKPAGGRGIPPTIPSKEDCPLRILIINPNSDENTDRIMAAKAKRLALPDVEVEVTHVTRAPKLVSSYEDQAVSGAEMIEIVRRREKDCDAFVVACHSDPNLDLVREITDRPVVGIAEASMKLAASMGNGFAVISPSPKSVSKKIALARKYHCDHLLRTIEVSKSDDEEDLLAAARRAAGSFGVDAIVLGCANYSNADRYLEHSLGIPVIEGVACALFIAAGLVSYQHCKQLS